MDVNKIISGALAGLVSAVAVDLDAFKKWQSVKEFQTFNWKLAALRWLKGAVLGALAGAGFGVQL